MTLRGIDLVLASSLPWLSLSAISVPLVLALAACGRRSWRQTAINLAPWAALPALVLVVQAQPGSMIELPWLLLGTRLGLDQTGQVFLGFTALLWLLAGAYARRYMDHDTAAHRFFFYYLLTMSGNIGLILAHDMLSFFLFFAVMSFASYGLIVHNHDVESVRAGRIYMILVMIGEVLLFAALILMASQTSSLYFATAVPKMAQSPLHHVCVALVLVGFGIKVGALPVHVWLPLAHPAAPTPASAVLSGAMIKAGLLGWMRFLHLGGVTLLSWGMVCMFVGLLAAFYGVLIGIFRRNPKTVLAYSSISQMGMLTVLVGVALTAPAAWSLVLMAILSYATHHALAKGALFLGVGVAAATPSHAWQRRWVTAGLLLSVLALTGAPLTSGALAKTALKTSTALAPLPWPEILEKSLSWAAVGTTMLMGRFLYLIWPQSSENTARLPVGLWLPWAVLLAGLPLMGLLLPWDNVLQTLGKSLAPKALKSALWPVGVGSILIWGIGGLHRRFGIKADQRIPAGDVLIPAVWLASHLSRAYDAYMIVPFARGSARLVSQCRHLSSTLLRQQPLLHLEDRLGRWTVAGTFFLLLGLIFLALFTVA
jgi:formate hydrogenlyase subunit 3/multisubunit Na+/H+ antiporter MnhD subunit